MNTISKGVFCKAEHRHTELFASKEDADNYISLNHDKVSGSTDVNHTRSVYCPECAGWHLANKPATDEDKGPLQINVLFSLERLINELKTSFDHDYWQVWKPRIEEARGWVAQLEDDESLSELLVEAKRQLVHYDTAVKNCARKYQRKTGIVRNRLKKVAGEVQQLMKNFKVAECAYYIREVEELVRQPWFFAMEKKEQEEWTMLYKNLSDEELMDRLIQASVMFKTVRVGINILPTEQLVMLHKNLSLKTEPGNGKEIHPIIRNPFRKELDNIQRQIKFRGTDYIDPKTGLDKVTVTLHKQLEWCKHKFEEVEETLSEKDTMGALYLLQSVDEHIRNIPLCKEKMKVLERMVDLSRQCI